MVSIGNDNFGDCGSVQSSEFIIDYYGFGIWGSLFGLFSGLFGFLSWNQILLSTAYLNYKFLLHGWFSLISVVVTTAALLWSNWNFGLFVNSTKVNQCVEPSCIPSTDCGEVFNFKHAWVSELVFLFCKFPKQKQNHIKFAISGLY